MGCFIELGKRYREYEYLGNDTFKLKRKHMDMKLKDIYDEMKNTCIRKDGRLYIKGIVFEVHIPVTKKNRDKDDIYY